MTRIEFEFMEKVPYELHKLNVNLEKIIDILMSMENGKDT